MKKPENVKPINMIIIFIAGIINAVGVTMFLQPVSLYDSGISGTSMLLGQLTPEFLSLSVFLVVLNVPLFILGLKRQGRSFTIYSIFAVTVYSVSAYLITYVLPIDVSIASPLANTDLFLCAIFGGVISGVGSGLTIRFGGAIDGMDVLSVIFAKHIGLSVGTFVMCYNVVLYVICGIALSSWILPLYSIVTYFAASKTIDFIIEGFDKAKSATIITTKPDEICAALSETFHTGVTLIKAQGYYSGNQQTMIYIIINRFQVTSMRMLVRRYDAGAFIAISDISDVFANEVESSGKPTSKKPDIGTESTPQEP